MPTFFEKLQPRKSSPNGAVEWTPSEAVPGGGLLRIGTKRATVEYLLVPLSADAGRAFKLAKVTPGTDAASESYDVRCSSGSAPRCECKGFTFVGNCKHADAVQALIANGWL